MRYQKTSAVNHRPREVQRPFAARARGRRLPDSIAALDGGAAADVSPSADDAWAPPNGQEIGASLEPRLRAFLDAAVIPALVERLIRQRTTARPAA